MFRAEPRDDDLRLRRLIGVVRIGLDEETEPEPPVQVVGVPALSLEPSALPRRGVTGHFCELDRITLNGLVVGDLLDLLRITGVSLGRGVASAECRRDTAVARGLRRGDSYSGTPLNSGLSRSLSCSRIFFFEFVLLGTFCLLRVFCGFADDVKISKATASRRKLVGMVSIRTTTGAWPDDTCRLRFHVCTGIDRFITA